MSEYSNDLYMQLEKGGRASGFVLSTGVRSVLLLYQFFKRLEKEQLLSGGEVRAFERFLKATEGRYDIMTIPYEEKDGYLGGTIKESKLSEIREALDRSGIRYSVLPDLKADDYRIQVAVFREDAQKFSAFYTSYLKGFLTGGEKDLPDFRNFLDGSVSIISIPDEAAEEMKTTLEKLHISFASLPDLDLKDGEQQILVGNSDTDAVERTFRLYQEGLLEKGEKMGNLRRMNEKDYQRTGKESADDYKKDADKKIREADEKYLSDSDVRFEEAIKRADSGMRHSDGEAFADYLKDENYFHISVDYSSLVKGTGAPELMEGTGRFFFCRMPGEEDLLAVPRERTFIDENGGKLRFIAFIQKDSSVSVVGTGGNNVVKKLPSSRVLEMFRPQERTPVPSDATPFIDVPFPAPVR